MGTNINVQIEYLDGTIGTWEVWAVIRGMSRNYSLFDAMSGGRSGADASNRVAAPRGIPADSPPALRDGELGEYGLSWLTLDECEEANRRSAAARPGLSLQGLEPVIAAMRAIQESGSEVRLVFGFD